MTDIFSNIIIKTKKYKDSVFTKLFSEKDKLIELFNAIEGTNYTMDANLEINTLENILYIEEGREEGREEGIVIGIEKGIEKGIVMFAVSLLGILEDDIIAEKSGLTLEEIKQLRKENEK